MPILHRRPHQQVLASRPMTLAMPSIENNETMGEPLWAVSEDYERPQKETDFPPLALCRAPSRKESTNNLRINTYMKSDLPDRYLSSEEEPSPSPDSETYEEAEEELKHKACLTHVDEVSESISESISEPVSEPTAEPSAVEEYKTETAVAVPIFVGRPKLVDITNLAPMHKRKRAATEKQMLLRSAVKKAASSISIKPDENSPFVMEEAIQNVTPGEELPKRKDSLNMPAPDSWLPDDATLVQEDEEEDHYFPDLELRKPLSYKDYDPYSLDPPRLSPRNSYSKNGNRPGSVARARNKSSPPMAMNNGWRGLTRSLSIAKRQTLHQGDYQVAKKSKMIARAANERAETPMIPPFPLGEGF